MSEQPTWTQTPPAPSSDDLAPGTMVGEYRIVSKVAKGGMGAVYAAAHPVIGKKAAIKILFRSLSASQELLQRFVDEARAVNRIGHQNIVDVFAFGSTVDGRSYFVMEWLEGETLFQRLVRGTPPIRESAQILDQLADALEAAHRKGIIHRDIKPENVFLVQDRDRVFVKLLDFGVAKLGMRRDTSEGHSVLGTPAYVSPEQASAREVDHRTDIYSLGVLAYEMLVGRRPFEAEAPIHFLKKHIQDAPPRPRSISPSTPPILDELLLRMLAKSPDDRPSLQELRDVLAEVGRAALLVGHDHRRRRPPEAGRAVGRPVLVRRFSRVADLASDLVPELSRGIAWATAGGNAPPPGTPITIRFEVERLLARVDFGGTVIRHLGGAGTKTLIRYDRVSKEDLGGVFATLASIGEGASVDRKASGEIGCHWLGAGSPTPDGIPDSVGAPARVEVLEGSPDAAESPPGSSRPEALRVRFGLGAKVLMLAVLVTIGAVAWLAILALERAKTDRGFYVRELNVRTSQLLLDGMAERLDKWKGTLTLAALGGSEGRLELGELETLTICPPRGAPPCVAVVGKPLSPELVAEVQRGAAERNGDLFVRARHEDLLLGIEAGGTIAIAKIPSVGLLDAKRVPDELTVLAIDGRGEELVERRDSSAVPARVAAHAILGDLVSGKSGSGAREYTAPDGTPMFGAWAKNRDLGVVLTTPMSLSEKATQVLKEQILWVALAILGVASTVALVFARTMTRRLRLLARHAGRVAEGDFGAPLDVRGRDEVGQLSVSFQSMTAALRQRDEDVLRIQRKMGEDASEALHRQMSEWLGMDLAPTLQAMQVLARRPIDEKEPLKDLQERAEGIEALSGQASLSLQQALALAAIASRRIDVASTVADAIAYVRTALHGSKVGVELEAKNAVLFPRLDARESEILELVQTLVGRIARALEAGDVIHASLHLGRGALVLVIRAPRPVEVKDVAIGAVAAVEPVLSGHGASAKIYQSPRILSVLIAFPVRDQVEPTP